MNRRDLIGSAVIASTLLGTGPRAQAAATLKTPGGAPVPGSDSSELRAAAAEAWLYGLALIEMS